MTQQQLVQALNDMLRNATDALEPELPEGTMFALFVFQNIEVESEAGVLAMMRSNVQDKASITQSVVDVLNGLLNTEVGNLIDTMGGMQ